jgi:pyruvate formate lyase activating enzyme
VISSRRQPAPIEGPPIAVTAMPASYWHRLADGRVQCDLCPRLCRLRDGEAGSCRVRVREGRRLVLGSYGCARGFRVEPVEALPLHHYLPGTATLAFGGAGCNLSCHFCDLIDTPPRALLCGERTDPEAIAQAALRHGCTSVALSEDEPVVFHEFALDVARACRARGLHVLATTAGYVNKRPRAELYAELDAVSVDLKSLSRRFYRTHCGGGLQPVLDTLAYVRHETDVWLEITTIVIPGLNDSDADIERLARYVVDDLGPDVPLHFHGFRPAGRLAGTPPTPRSSLARARHIALEAGARHVYAGGTDDPVAGSTYCAGCGRTLIGRNGLELTDWHLGHGAVCALCRTPLPGHFEPEPGACGPHRIPIQIEPVLAPPLPATRTAAPRTRPARRAESASLARVSG